MKTKICFFLILVQSLCSCTNTEKEFKDGFHKAYVEIQNPKPGQSTRDGAFVLTKDDIVVKICFSNDDCVDNFDMWEQHDHYQIVFAQGIDERIYTVYIIPDEWKYDEPVQENDNN